MHQAAWEPPDTFGGPYQVSAVKFTPHPHMATAILPSGAPGAMERDTEEDTAKVLRDMAQRSSQHTAYTALATTLVMATLVLAMDPVSLV